MQFVLGPLSSVAGSPGCGKVRCDGPLWDGGFLGDQGEKHAIRKELSYTHCLSTLAGTSPPPPKCISSTKISPIP